MAWYWRNYVEHRGATSALSQMEQSHVPIAFERLPTYNCVRRLLYIYITFSVVSCLRRKPDDGAPKHVRVVADGLTHVYELFLQLSGHRNGLEPSIYFLELVASLFRAAETCYE